MRQSPEMEVFQTLDQQWTPLLFVCGVPLFLLGIVLRSVSARREFSWRIGNAALYLGTVFVAIAVVLHFVLPYVVTTMTEALPG